MKKLRMFLLAILAILSFTSPTTIVSAATESFEWQGHDPEKNGWNTYWGAPENAEIMHWYETAGGTMFKPTDGAHLFVLSPKGDDAIIKSKSFLVNAGDVISLDWAVDFPDYAPYVDQVFGYGQEPDGTFLIFSSNVFDGSSKGWKTATTVPFSVGGFVTVSFGAMNALDTWVSPVLLIDNIYIGPSGKGFAKASLAPVPVPAALWLFGSVIAGFFARRRRT